MPAVCPRSSLPQAWELAALSPQCLSFAQARYESMYCPFRQKKIISEPEQSMHNGFYVCTISGVWGFVISVVLLCTGRSACKDEEFREEGQLRAHTGVQEKVGRCKADLPTPGSFLHCLCRAKPGEEGCLNDTRWVQKGATQNQRGESQGKRCKFPLPARQGVGCSSACAQCGVQPGQRPPHTMCPLGQMGKMEKLEHSYENQ